MKTYALFAGHGYYPEGGSDDFRAFGDTVEELQALYAENADKWSIQATGSYADPWGKIALTATMETILTDRRKEGWQHTNQ